MRPFYAFLSCLLLAATSAAAGPGHGHDPAASGEFQPMSPRVESAGGGLEIVATATGHKLTIYLDRLATNEPVNGATIEVSGEGIAPAIAKPTGEGTYEIGADWADTPGERPLIFTVTAGDSIELLNGVLEIPEPASAQAEASPGFRGQLASPLLWAVAGIAVLLGFVLAFAFRPVGAATERESAVSAPAFGTKPAAPSLGKVAHLIFAGALILPVLSWPVFAHGGDDHGAEGVEAQTGNAPRRLPDGSVFVPKPSQRLLHVRTKVVRSEEAVKGRELIGTVVPNPSSFGKVQAPMDGRIELAKRGISYVGQRVTSGEVLALLFPTIPVADLGTMQQLSAEVAGKLKIAEQKLGRLTRIAGVIAQKDIDDTKAELEALREQQRVLATKDVDRIELTAPVSGIISVANVRAGQVVTTRDTLFEIVDPERVWIEAISTGVHETTDIGAASAEDADGHDIKLSFIGRAPALRQQSLPLQFKADEVHDGLIIGSAVKVFVRHGGPVRGIVLPDAAVVRAQNGLPQVWEKVSAERFKPLPVKTSPLDGTHVLVLSGIPEGSRVVTEGAELINQVR